jgi:asparagine synthase (glutamine-hydrolysing)
LCGIVGYLATGQFSAHFAECALGSIAHRGPDSEGQWHKGRVFLGMRRLSIIDLAGGQQPIWNEDSTCCIVYNGELYNFQSLRGELKAKGHQFRTNSDTEVVLHAYEEWGPGCLNRFNGMFAFAIWDETSCTLFLARDRLGEKPLYYYHDGDMLIFASEIKAILSHPSVPRRMDLRGLSNFLSFGHAVAPTTIYQKIVKLLPGHYLLATGGQVTTHQYWDVGDEPQIPEGASLTEAEYSRRVLELLDDSVRIRMVADVPLGAFLSGGVDSSAIVALMKRHASGPVKTFSLGFSNAGYNELADARRVVTAHRHIALSGQQTAVTKRPRLAAGLCYWTGDAHNSTWKTWRRRDPGLKTRSATAQEFHMGGPREHNLPWTGLHRQHILRQNTAAHGVRESHIRPERGNVRQPDN